LKEHPTLAPRLQRDLPRLIALIKAYALLNCFTRERTKDGQGIWASQRDVEEGYRLYSSIGESNELGIPPQIHKLWMEAIKPVLTDEGLTRKDLARLYFEYYTTRVGRKQLAQTWELLCEVGLVMEQPDPNDRRIMRIYPPEGGGEKIIQGDSAGEDLYKTSSPLSGGIYSDPIPNLPKPELSLQEDLEKLIENVTSLQRRNRSNDPIPKEEVKQDLGWEEDYFNRILKIIVREKRLYETPDGRIGVSW